MPQVHPLACPWAHAGRSPHLTCHFTRSEARSKRLGGARPVGRTPGPEASSRLVFTPDGFRGRTACQQSHEDGLRGLSGPVRTAGPGSGFWRVGPRERNSVTPAGSVRQGKVGWLKRIEQEPRLDMGPME